jgi:hypothetical protein
MSWAARRRLVIVSVIALVVVVIVAAISYFSFHRAPSCVDGIQNQQEQGIDCGGPCAYLCAALEQVPVVRFTQAIAEGPGRTDVIAYIDNSNQDAYARGVSYSLSLYGADHALGAPVIHGVTDLPPGASVPIFIPNINTANSVITTAFLTIDPAAIKWQAGTDTRVIPQVGNQTLTSTSTTPRITATLTNPSARPLSDIKVVVTIYDASGNVINASQTIVPSIAGQGSAVATFTWNAPFSAPAARIDVVPVIPLP